MIEEKHAEMVQALVKPGKAVLAGLSPAKAHLLHMALGLAGEAGEVVDALKKCVIYGKLLDRDHLTEELGDVEFYLQGLRAAAGISRDSCLAANTTKLRLRYASGAYTNEQAQARADKEEGQ